MRCAHWDLGECRSCAWLPVPYAEQLTTKTDLARRELSPFCAPNTAWLPPIISLQTGFRNKAKLVVTGTLESPILGLPDVDLTDCPLYPQQLRDTFEPIRAFITQARLVPYRLGPIENAENSRRAKRRESADRGELKYVIVTVSPDDEFMARFVLRSQESVARIRKHLPTLFAALPGLVVVSINIQSEHKAVLEGDQEIVLTEQTTLPMRLGVGSDLTLQLGPLSFFQTNTEVAAALYQTAQNWVNEIAPRAVLDLYCGVGGFAMACAAPGRRVVGVETSAEAITSARVSASEFTKTIPGTNIQFEAADATGWSGLAEINQYDVVIVNPPRRGIGPQLAAQLELADVPWVLYSSCNLKTLTSDLMQMPSLRIVQAQVLDMFPNTAHFEMIVLLRRESSHC